MTQSRDLPELVQDSELEVTIHDNITIHNEPLECRDMFAPQVWETKRTIGRGGDGTVFLQQKIDGPGAMDMLAVKQISLNADLASEDHDSRRYVRELEALAKFSQGRYSRYFVKSYGWYQEAGWLYICMEHCKHLDLGKHLKIHGALSEASARAVALQILQGLLQMHRNKIAHRDLKPANILIHRKPPEDDAWWVVLGDLGLSRRSGASSGTTTVRGTPSFMAPEAIGRPFLGHPNDADPFPADMWCLGETISCALTGHSTFSDNEQLLQYQKRRVRFPDDALKQSSASTDAIDFIRCLMEVDPLQRLTAAQALNHAWIKVNHTPHTHTTKTIASNSLRDIKPVFSTSTKNFDMETVVVNRELPIRDQITQASAQWTQTVPIRLNDAKAPVKSVETISSAPRTSPNLSVKRKVLRRTPDIEIVKKIEAPALDQYQDYRDLMPSSAEQRLDTQRDYHVLASYADYDTLGSSRRFAAAERLPTVPSRSPLTSKDKRVRWADLENSDKESTLSTSAQTGLRPNPSNKKEPSRREEVPDLQHALRHYFETGQWYGIDPRALKEGQNSSLSRSQTWIPESGPPPEFAPPSEFGSPPRSPGDKHDHSDPPTPTPVQIPPPLLATKVQRHLHVPAIDINVSGNPLRLQPQLKTISRANTETGKSAQPSDSAQKKDKKQSADSHGQVHGRSTLTEAWNKYMTQFAKDREPEERKTRSRRS